MTGIGSTGCYVDAEGNEYAATVVGRTFKVETPADGGPVAKVETGALELECVFRDGTRRLFSSVAPDELLEPGARERTARGDFQGAADDSDE